MTDPFLSASKRRNRINLQAFRQVISEMSRQDLEKFLIAEYLTCVVYHEFLGPVNFACLTGYGFPPEELEDLASVGREPIEKAIKLSNQIIEGN